MRRVHRPGTAPNPLRSRTEGYSGEVDLAEEAIGLTRQVTSLTSYEEPSGLLARVLLHHARHAADRRGGRHTGPSAGPAAVDERDHLARQAGGLNDLLRA